MTVVGHSQGCSYVAEVAARTGSPNVVMLEGVGVGPGAVTSLQSEFQLPIFKNVLTYLKQAGASAADILAAEQQVGVTQCYAQYSVAQMDTVRDGTLAPWLTTNPLLNSFPVLTPAAVTDALYDALIAKGLNTTLLAEMGIAKGGVICPGANITGAPGCACDEAGVAKPKCELLCSGAQLAGNGPSVGFLFYSSWIDVGSLEYLKQSVLRLPANSRIMATNGWADAKVPLDVFSDMHTLLTRNTTSVNYGTFPLGAGHPSVSNSGPVRLSLDTFSNISHDLVDVNAPFENEGSDNFSTFFHIRSDVASAVAGFVCAGPSVQCAPPPPPFAPDFLLIAGIVGVVGGILFGVALTLFAQWARYKCLLHKVNRLDNAGATALTGSSSGRGFNSSTSSFRPNARSRGGLRAPVSSSAYSSDDVADVAEYVSLKKSLHPNRHPSRSTGHADSDAGSGKSGSGGGGSSRPRLKSTKSPGGTQTGFV
eukprot:INCI7217.3.p1 GENE.INCI7217.3~~INCI7217.3.p1  ORF type:complete len:559 (-),score=87.21 INCI7217.3:329-1768(-)